MPTDFTAPSSPPTSWPHYPIEVVALALADFFVGRTPAEWRDARELFSKKVDYVKAEEYIQDGVEAASSQLSQGFYQAMRALHGALQTAQEWTQVLGTVAETAIRFLLERKYRTEGTPHMKDELCAHLYDCPLPPPSGKEPLVSMGDKPMDAICWDVNNDIGEMIEVKRLIVNFTDAEKVRLMREFKRVTQEQTGKSVWIGVAGFYDPVSEAEETLRTLLLLWDEAEPLQLDILVPETYDAWTRQHYL